MLNDKSPLNGYPHHPSQDQEPFEACLQQSSLPLRTTSLQRPVSGSMEDSSWVLMQAPVPGNSYRPELNSNEMMPASGDFRTAFEQMLSTRPLPRALQPAPELDEMSCSWPSQQTPTVADEQDFMHGLPYVPPSDIGHDFGFSFHANSSPYQFYGQPASTVVPAEAFSGDDVPSLVGGSSSLESSFASFDDCSPSSPYLSHTTEDVYPMVKSESPQRRASEDRKRRGVPKVVRSIGTTHTGGKCVKAEKLQRSNSGVGKRRCRQPRINQYSVRSGDCVLEVFNEIPDRISEEKPKKFKCTRIVNGQVCDKTFKRPEHQKRHEKTHDPHKPFPCWVPGCKKREEKLGRNDNRLDHLFTHIKPKKGRNKKVENPAQLFEYIREGEIQLENKKRAEEGQELLKVGEVPENAKKAVDKLCKKYHHECVDGPPLVRPHWSY